MKWERVIVHHSAGNDTSGLETDNYRTYHTQTRGWSDIGYHAVVELVEGSYEVIAGRPLNVVGAHCRGKNTTALGICLAGDFTDLVPPQEQQLVAAQHIAGWMDAFNMSATALGYHGMYGVTKCPGVMFLASWPDFVGLVDQHRTQVQKAV